MTGRLRELETPELKKQMPASHGVSSLTTDLTRFPDADKVLSITTDQQDVEKGALKSSFYTAEFLGSYGSFRKKDDGNGNMVTVADDNFVYMGLWHSPDPVNQGFRIVPTSLRESTVMPFIIGKRTPAEAMRSEILGSAAALRYTPTGIENVSAAWRPSSRYNTQVRRTGVGNFNGSFVDINPTSRTVDSNIRMNINPHIDSRGISHAGFTYQANKQFDYDHFTDDNTYGNLDSRRGYFQYESNNGLVKGNFMGSKGQFIGVTVRYDGHKDSLGRIAGAVILKKGEK